MTDGKKVTTVMFHQLVADAFLSAPSAGRNVTRHLNGDPTDNRAENLAWGTQKENMNDCIRHGRTLKGLKNPNAKLTDRTVEAIRILVDEGYSANMLAGFFAVDGDTIRRAASGEHWGHVGKETQSDAN